MNLIKSILVAFCLMLIGFNAQGQDYATDWTKTDVNGVEHNIFADLEAGYTVAIKFFATWCGACWGTHVQGYLQDTYELHGPDGDDTWRIYYIEVDPSTGMSELSGSGSTLGNWLQDLDIPVIEDDQFSSIYQNYGGTGGVPRYVIVCPEDQSLHQFYPGSPNSNNLQAGGLCPDWTGGPVGGGGSGGSGGGSPTTTFQGSVAFQGYQASGDMSTNLADSGLLPMTQPFNVAPFNYDGNESISTLPNNVVDWVMVELRDPSDESNRVDRKAALVDKDGNIMDTNGNMGVTFDNAPEGNYYVVIHHSGHVSIMSSATISLPNASPYSFMVTNGSVKGTNQLKLSSGAMVMRSGDYNNNGTVNFTDFILWLQNNNTLNAYESFDADGNGTVNFGDFISWFGNNNHLRYPGI